MKLAIALVLYCITTLKDYHNTFSLPSRLLHVFSSSFVWFIRLIVSGTQLKTAFSSLNYITANMVAG